MMPARNVVILVLTALGARGVDGSCGGHTIKDSVILTESRSDQGEEFRLVTFDCPYGCFVNQLGVCDENAGTQWLSVRCSDGTVMEDGLNKIVKARIGDERSCDTGGSKTVNEVNGFKKIEIRVGGDLNGVKFISVSGKASEWFGCSNCQQEKNLDCGDNKVITGMRVRHNGDIVKGLRATCSTRVCAEKNYYKDYTCTACPTCTAGKYRSGCTGSSAGSCVTCPAGTFSLDGAWEGCTGCLASENKYQDSADQSSCKTCATCGAGSYISTACTNTANGACSACAAGSYQPNGGVRVTACTPCEAGKFQPNTGASACRDWTVCPAGNYTSQTPSTTQDRFCVTCQCPANTFINCPTGASAKSCPVCAGHEGVAPCGAGRQPSVQCDGTQTRNATCEPCAAGAHKPDASARWCVACPTGTFKAASGTGNCTACTNKRNGSLSVYEAWGVGVQRTSNTCPWACVAGYFRSGDAACVACNATAGTFAATGGQTACSVCTNRPSNSTYLVPRGFDGRSDGCPWVCNAGFWRVPDVNLCVPCAAGKFRLAQQGIREGDQQTACGECGQCVAGSTYETGACRAWADRTCGNCTANCAAGQWKTHLCNPANNTRCAACATRCGAGFYLSGDACDGTTVVDVVLQGCRRCLTPETGCEAGKTYLTAVCSGTETEINRCAQCDTSRTCASGFYQGGCGGLNNTQCLPYRQCGGGQYLLGESDVSDGVCAACQSCGAVGLVQLLPCSRFEDSVCGGRDCSGDAAVCGARQFCDALGVPGSFACGACPRGYGSDRWQCVECPEGKTCDVDGEVRCSGQCKAGVRSECDAGLGYARCDEESAAGRCNATRDGGMAALWRGSYKTPLEQDCVTYFRCAVGFFKRFLSSGRAECTPCVGRPWGALSRWTTPGLTANANGSCLWECDYGLQAPGRWNGTACAAGARRAVVPHHRAGWYGAEGVQGFGVATCGSRELTSEANTSLVGSDGCVACPPPPEQAVRASETAECGWTCNSGYAARGGRCVWVWQDGEACDEAGRTLLGGEGGGCVPSSVPWNRAGTRKVVPYRVAVEWVAPQSGHWVGVARVNATTRVLAGGVLEHAVHVAGRTAALGVVAAPGAVCSSTLVTLRGGHSYVIAAMCEQSFLAFLNLSAQQRRWEVLIGRAGETGWTDGHKTQARFGTELYVAAEADRNGSVWVLDRWNCLVREVVIWPEPGDYRTRVYTVHGLTERFAVTGQAKCVGPGSLAGPRRFWEVGHGLALFTDEDNGLWQLELGSGALTQVVGGGAWLQAAAGGGASVVAATLDPVLGRFAVLLRVVSGASVASTWRLTAVTEACPEDLTSRDGGDCVRQCEWPGSFVDPASGACVACDTQAVGACGLGQRLVGCTRRAQARCEACPEAPGGGGAGTGNRVYVVRGTCDAALMRRAGPVCEKGEWLRANESWCELCPSGKTTVSGGATRAEQCKCSAVNRWLRWNATIGACVGWGPEQRHYDGAGQACAAEGGAGCNVPPNASLVSGHGHGQCLWRCHVGFYRRTEGAWMDKCGACARGPDERPFVTDGDDDAPLSCET